MLKSIIPQRRFIYKAILLTVFLLISYLFFRDNWNKKKEKILSLLKTPWIIVFFLYTGYMLSATVVGRYAKNPIQNVFGGFRIVDNEGKIDNDFLLNIVMFITYTLLYIKAFNPTHRFKSALCLSIMTAIFIELSQLVGWLGEFQFADILHNILGGLIGCLLWELLRAARKEHWIMKGIRKIMHYSHNGKNNS